MENEAMIISRAKIKDGELINLVKYDPYKGVPETGGVRETETVLDVALI